jgi:hypothetical protein
MALSMHLLQAIFLTNGFNNGKTNTKSDTPVPETGRVSFVASTAFGRIPPHLQSQIYRLSLVSILQNIRII